MKNIDFRIFKFGSKIVFLGRLNDDQQKHPAVKLGEVAGGGFVAVAVGPSDR